MSKLKEWDNAEETGRHRFYPSSYYCPQCGEKALIDEWPPNYGGGHTSMFGTDAQTSEYGGSQKCVCVPCKLFFRVSTWEKRVNGHIVESRLSIHDEVPLLEDGDFLLTPHDVWRETYKEEHGEYPVEAYA